MRRLVTCELLAEGSTVERGGRVRDVPWYRQTCHHRDSSSIPMPILVGFVVENVEML